jgi:Family of unknown function (DUF5670)
LKAKTLARLLLWESRLEKLTFRRKGRIMLWTIFVILLILWLLGFATGTTLGGLIHLLIVLALILLIYNQISGRRGTS